MTTENQTPVELRSAEVSAEMASPYDGFEPNMALTDEYQEVDGEPPVVAKAYNPPMRYGRPDMRFFENTVRGRSGTEIAQAYGEVLHSDWELPHQGNNHSWTASPDTYATVMRKAGYTSEQCQGMLVLLTDHARDLYARGVRNIL